MEGNGEPQNLDDFAVVSCGILQTGPFPWIWQNFPRKTVGPSYSHLKLLQTAKNRHSMKKGKK